MGDLVLLIIVIAWIGFRAGRAVAMDDVGEPIRRWSQNLASGNPRSKRRRNLVKLLECPHCIGWWLTLIISFIVSAQLADYDLSIDIIAACAAGGLASLFSTYAQSIKVEVVAPVEIEDD